MNLLLATLVLTVPLAEPTDIRMVAADVEGSVTWTVDGAVVAHSDAHEPVRLRLENGTHRIEAEADDDQWIIMARPEPRGTGAIAVEAWTARAPQELFPGAANPRTPGTPEMSPPPAAPPAAPGPLWLPAAGGAMLAAFVLLAPKQP